MLKNLQGMLNALLIAWTFRTSFILYLALKNKAREKKNPYEVRSFTKKSDITILISVIIPAFNEEASIVFAGISFIYHSWVMRCSFILSFYVDSKWMPPPRTEATKVLSLELNDLPLQGDSSALS